MGDAWQEAKADAFRFGRPRFYPLILILYWQGARTSEYTGVVSASAITEFLRRHRAPKSGTDLVDAAAVREFVGGEAALPGPHAVGCGLEERLQEVFTNTAKDMHGRLVFGRASPEACAEAFSGLEPPWPKVVWVRDMAYFRSLADTKQMQNVSKLVKWLSLHQTKLLEEMTPDNSHVYLEIPVPLVIYLATPGDQKSMQRGQEVFGEIDREIEAKRFGKDREFQFVWSDCRVFAKQFDSVGQCPTVVLVNPMRMNWARQPMSAVERAAEGSGVSASERLLLWLRNTSMPWRAELDRFSAQRDAAMAATEESTDPEETAEAKRQKQKMEREDEEETKEGPGGTLEREDKEYLNEVFDLSKIKNITIADSFRGYHGLLEFMAQVRSSFKSRYGKTLSFDFEPMDIAQSLHPHMKLLVQSPTAVQKVLKDPKKLTHLWKAVESRAAFAKVVDKGEIKQKEEFSSALLEGWNLLRRLFRKLYQYLHRQLEMGALGVPERKPKEVERRDGATLSLREFLEEYAIPGRPVIITGLNLTQEKEWTLDFFRKECKNQVKLVKRNKLRGSWGRLEKGGVLPLPEFIDTFKTNETRRKWYLHDWSLPRNCPAVFGPPPYRGFTVPKYFSGDYFQRSAFDGYQHTWPSLFIGSKETQSDMHIDSGGTNFWMYLLSGQKEWRFYSRKDIVSLYKNPLKESFEVDVFEPNLTKYPLVSYAQQYVGFQEPGELIFIPGGNPHAVRNTDDIHGVSMNYVDMSNVNIYLWHQLVDEQFSTNQWMSVEMFTDNVSFPHGLRSDQEPLSFGEWKSTQWKDLTYDLV